MRSLLRQYFLAASIAVVALGFSASPARAFVTPDRDSVDARLEGYTPDVTLQGGGTSTIWFMAVGLTILCIGVMFKNANRSHLD